MKLCLGILVSGLAIVSPIALTSCSSSSSNNEVSSEASNDSTNNYESVNLTVYIADDNSYYLYGSTDTDGNIDIQIIFKSSTVENLTIESTYTYNGQTYTVQNISVGYSDINRSKVYVGNLVVKGCESFSFNGQFTSYFKVDSISVLNATRIIPYAFWGCSTISSINLTGSNLQEMGDYAFYACTDLKNIYLPDSVTSIGSNAFYYCTSLTSITIPNSVTSIGSSAFRYCSSLSSITIPKGFESSISSIFGSNITAEITYI